MSAIALGVEGVDGGRAPLHEGTLESADRLVVNHPVLADGLIGWVVVYVLLLGHVDPNHSVLEFERVGGGVSMDEARA